MNIKYLFFLVFLHPLLVIAATWIVDNNGNWDDADNWYTIDFPNGVDEVADFFNAIMQNRTVTLGQDITIGTVNFDNENRYRISGSDSLFFEVLAGTAEINISNSNGDGAHRILCPVVLNDDLTVNHMSDANVRINGDISGVGTFIKTGDGRLQLRGTGSYLGTTEINAGDLVYNNAGCIPGGSSVTIGGGTSDSALIINRDMAVGNALAVISSLNGVLVQNNGDIVRLISLAGDGSCAKSTGPGNQNFIDLIGSTDTTFSGVISGGNTNVSSNPTVGNRILKSGTSTLTLEGSNLYVCRTFIQSGAINVQDGMALGADGADSAAYVRAGGTLEIENNISLTKTININGTGSGSAGAIHNVSGDNTLSSVVTVGWSGGAETDAAATVQVNGGTMLTMSGVVQGSTDLTLIGAGTLEFSGMMPNTHTGTTIINSGTLNLNKMMGANAIVGHINLSGGTLLLSQPNQIADTSDVTINSGTWDMNDKNDTIHRLIFNGGTLAQGMATLSFVDGLTMRDTTISGDIILMTGGTVVFDATNNGTAVISGNIDHSGAVITYTIANGTEANDMTISGVIDNGGLTKEGAGTLELTGVNTYTGDTTVAEGTLNLNAAGTAIASHIDLSGGTLLLSQPNQIADTSDVTISSGAWNMNGNNDTINHLTFNGGALTQGGAALTLNNGLTMRNTTISGDLTLANGTVAFDATSNGTALISGNIDQGAAIITYDIANGAADLDMEISGAISGNGQLIKIGSGTLLFSGASPSYTGITTIDQGELILNGSLAGLIRVNSGGTLSGTGTAGELVNDGTLVLGASIGTLTVNENYMQTNTAFLVVEIDDIPAISDSLEIMVEGNLNGAVVLNPLPGIYEAGTTYTFLTAGNIQGGFSQLLETHPLDFIIVPIGTTSLQIVIPFTEAVLPVPINELEGNARSIANYLFTCPLVPSPNFLAELRALVKLPAESFAESLLKLGPEQFGGLALTRLQTGARIGQSMNRVKNFYDHGFLTPCYRSFVEPDSRLDSMVWANPIGYYYKQNKADDQVPFNNRMYGFTTGFSRRFWGHLVVSAGTGYTHSNLNWFQDRGNATIQAIYLSPSVGYLHERGYLGLAVVGGHSFYSVKRKIQYSTVREIAENHHRSWDLFAKLNGGLKIKVPDNFQRNLFIIPTVALDYINVFENGYQETGANSLDLAVESVYSAFFRSEITVKFLKEITIDTVCLSPNLSIGWLKNVPLTNGHYTSNLYREQLCQDNFTVQSYHSSTDQMVLGAELIIAYKQSYSLNINYEANFGNHFNIQEGSVNFNWRF
ncbi:MAG: autotransporter domain-containing protein [Chlamydiota bacterium]